MTQATTTNTNLLRHTYPAAVRAALHFEKRIGLRPHFSLIAMAVALVATSGCIDGRGSVYERVQSSGGGPLSQICVIPLYKKLDGMSYGPDGTGGHIYPGFYLQAPYIFSSGENFMTGQLPPKKMIPPFIAYGTGYSASRFLLVKRGYAPLLIRDSDLYDDQPLTLTEASPSETEEVIAMLTAKPPKQEELFSLFHIQNEIHPERDPIKDEFHVEFTNEDIALLKSCGAERQGESGAKPK